MTFLRSGARPSSIVALSQEIQRRSAESGLEYLRCERGIPAVCSIDLPAILPTIDFGDPALLTYPPSTGQPGLKAAINAAYFSGRADPHKIFITTGASMGLDLLFQMLDVDRVVLPEVHWPTYREILKVHRRTPGTYASLEDLHDRPADYARAAVVLCDPNNPTGDKLPDALLLRVAARLGEAGVSVIIDCPYRRIFFEADDPFFREMSAIDNVVIVESFSKTLGMSGLRAGFVYTVDPAFAAEFGLRLALPSNGVDNFAQRVAEKFLADPRGLEAARRFRRRTVIDVERNIALLEARGLLARPFYRTNRCMGIFAIVAKTEAELLAGRIGSMSLESFTESNKAAAARYARVNVAVPHERFAAFFGAIQA